MGRFSPRGVSCMLHSIKQNYFTALFLDKETLFAIFKNNVNVSVGSHQFATGGRSSYAPQIRVQEVGHDIHHASLENS